MVETVWIGQEAKNFFVHETGYGEELTLTQYHEDNLEAGIEVMNERPSYYAFEGRIHIIEWVGDIAYDVHTKNCVFVRSTDIDNYLTQVCDKLFRRD
jgi:hypothetical protein